MIITKMIDLRPEIDEQYGMLARKLRKRKFDEGA
jgi:hypothetical protein